MAKKQSTPVHESSSNKLSIALGFLGEASPEQLEEARKIPGISKVIGSSGNQLISELHAAAADLTILAFKPQQVKAAYVQAVLKKAASEKALAQRYFTLAEGSNKSRLTELFSGFGKAEWQNAFVAFGRTAFSRFASEGILPSDSYELAYLAEKTCCNNEIIEGDKKEVAKPKAVEALTKKIRTSIKYYTGGGAKAMHKFLFLGLSVIALALGMIMSRDAGISGDEFTQYEYSKLTANYYESMLGNDISVDTMGLKGQKMTTLVKKSYSSPANLATQEDPERLMHLYGASFDTFTTLLSRWFEITEIMDFRHLMNSIFGFLCMFFGALIVHRIAGGNWKFAWLTLILLFCTPRLLGESFNNPKDIPFAAGYVMAIYYTIKAFSNLHVIRISALLGLIFSIALGISIRIGGVLSIAIFIMYAGLQYINKIGQKEFISLRWKGFGKLLIPVAGVAFCSYLLGIFVWPYGWDDPFTNPIKAFKSFSNYSGSIRQLFEGKMFDSDMLPSYYLAKYILITTPIAALLGLLLTLIPQVWKRTRFNLNFFLIFFSAVFPVLFIFIQKSQVYGGLRHILFTIPMFVISGVIGYYLISEWWKEKKWAAYAVPGLALGLTILPASFIAKNHPLEYIYFNELVGGTSGAYGKYEMDYYLAGLRPSTEWFLKNVARKNPEKKFTIVSYGMDQVKYYCRLDTNVKVGFARYDDRVEARWDYAIFYNAYMDKTRLLGGKYPPIGTVYSPVVSGKPMGLVIRRPSQADNEGFQADRKGDYRLAVSKYKEYLEADKNSNEVYLYMSYAYANLKNLDSAIWCANKSVELYPEFTKSLFALNQFYTQKNDLDNALKAIDKVIEVRPQDADAHLLKAQTQARKGDLNGSVESIHKAIAIAPLDVRSYQLGAQLYSGLKDNLSASQYNNAALLFSAKDAATYEKGITALKEIYLGITGKELDTDKLLNQ